ncbi:hypothetical protein [uncultured Alistipes sp.]|uniref:hypothetical protein n=1 Tax=uncultured Alistipes sp. TaxID=538949 RepID=UPI0025F8E61F|nr:hypothetical protein [uncultured Alistipes sp.]
MKPLYLMFVLSFGVVAAVAQERTPQAVLRFDQASSEELADLHVAADAPAQDDGRPFAYKLNRRRVSEAAAYDAVTLWNVRRVRVKSRRMRLSDTTGRERVRLLKFFIERDRRKGARPHLLGNVVGYTWVSHIREGGRWREVPAHIGLYTLRPEVDSLRRAGQVDARGAVPEAFRHALPRDIPYVLDGVEVPSPLFQFIDGLILRTLSVVCVSEGRPCVVGDTYPGRSPLVVLGGERTTVAAWLEMCRAGLFEMSAGVPMHYYYILPVEAVQLYGEAGRYGAIRIDMAE